MNVTLYIFLMMLTPNNELKTLDVYNIESIKNINHCEAISKEYNKRSTIKRMTNGGYIFKQATCAMDI